MDQVKLIYQGTNALVLKKGDSTLLIDPYYSRLGLGHLLTRIEPNPKRVDEGLRSAGVDGVNGILLTHTHYDHALDATEVVRQQGGKLFGSESATNLAKGAGLNPKNYQKVRMGQPYHDAGFRIVFHPSKHIPFRPPMKWLLPEKGRIEKPIKSPAWFWEYRCGEVFAIQVDRLLILGSAGYTPGAYEDLDIESVAFPIGGLETKPSEYLSDLYNEVVIASGASRVLVSHWDQFFKPDISEMKFLGLARKNFKQIAFLGNRHGQTVELLRSDKPYYI